MDANNRTISNDTFSSPVSCDKLKLIGYYCCIVFCIGFTCNCLSLCTFMKHKCLRTPCVNRLHILLQFVNLFGGLSQMPLMAVNAFLCRFSFGVLGCYLIAFNTYFVGCFSIYIVTAISCERYWIVCRPFQKGFISVKATILVVSCSFLMSLAASTAPIFGWSYYTLEGSRVSCCVKWNSRSINVLSYNLTIFVFVFILPGLIILITNFKIISTLKDSKAVFGRIIVNGGRARTERRVTVFSMIIIIGFFLSWTPYAILAMYMTFLGDVSPMTSTIPSLISKTSFLWPSIFHLIGNRHVGRECKLRKLRPFLTKYHHLTTRSNSLKTTQLIYTPNI